MTLRWRVGWFGVWCALAAGAAAAHTRSESLSVWTVDGAEVRSTVTVPEVEARRLVPEGAAAPGDAALAADLAAYLAQRLAVSAGGERCPQAGAPVAAAATRGFRRIELRWRCPAGRAIELHSAAFFDLAPTHVMYARVRVGDRFSEQLLDTDRRSLALGDDAGALRSAGFAEYVRLGVSHIVTGPDHIAFLLGLVLISARFRDLALVVTGFTLGHSATLALAVTGWLRPQPELIDVLIALTIGLVGAENVAAGLVPRRARGLALAAGGLLLAMAALKAAGFGRLPPALLLGAALFAPCYLLLATRLQDAAPVRAVVTGVFGLIHGFAFANDLIEMQLPPGRLAGLLFGFNLGVEAGQLLIVALMLAVAGLLVRVRAALPRPLVVDGGSAALVGLALFWIVGRTYG